jgi:hypothetical protein
MSTSAPPPTAPPGARPALAIRLVTTYADTTRRVDLQVSGGRGQAVEAGRATPFETADLWPTVRDLLPPVEPLRAAPSGLRHRVLDPRAPGPGWAEQCRAMVSLATVIGAAADADPTSVVVRTWFATDDELWSATPLPDGTTDVRLATPGDLAELLVWDVTGALEALVHALPEPVR